VAGSRCDVTSQDWYLQESFCCISHQTLPTQQSENYLGLPTFFSCRQHTRPSYAETWYHQHGV